MPREPEYIICSPADSAFTERGSVFDRSCAECGIRLMLSPSGQMFLRRRPEGKTVCWPCLEKITARSGNGTVEGVLGGGGEILTDPEAVRNEFRRISRVAVPNRWRERN